MNSVINSWKEDDLILFETEGVISDLNEYQIHATKLITATLASGAHWVILDNRRIRTPKSPSVHSSIADFVITVAPELSIPVVIAIVASPDERIFSEYWAHHVREHGHQCEVFDSVSQALLWLSPDLETIEIKTESTAGKVFTLGKTVIVESEGEIGSQQIYESHTTEIQRALAGKSVEKLIIDNRRLKTVLTLLQRSNFINFIEQLLSIESSRAIKISVVADESEKVFEEYGAHVAPFFGFSFSVYTSLVESLKSFSVE